jgi:hypothetical protein
MTGDLYCVDSSSLIRLKQDFPRSVFPAVWEKIEELVEQERIIAPDEVLREIKREGWVFR